MILCETSMLLSLTLMYRRSDSDASELAPDLHEYLQAIMDAVYDDGSDGDDD